MAVYEFEGKRPSIGRGSYIHPEATIIGDVTLGEGCYVGAGARIRGDWGTVVIGPGSNIQENCIIHAYPGKTARLGPRSHIGHGAILHTPDLGEHVLVGMGAILMDYVSIGDGCCIGAGALVTERTVIPPNKLVLGIPARVVADISDKMRKDLEEATGYYLALPPRCHRGLKEIKLEEVLER
ncbi:MAG: gamma carbonic anhydrase family protein [Peptococcaceae bacterium]|nr:gamma carbonic anhydrase family protein [Peptococcaceae bacterium]